MSNQHPQQESAVHRSKLVLIEPSTGRILMMITDNNKKMKERMRNVRILPGGVANEGESNAAAALRELGEEIKDKDGNNFAPRYIRNLQETGDELKPTWTISTTRGTVHTVYLIPLERDEINSIGGLGDEGDKLIFDELKTLKKLMTKSEREYGSLSDSLREVLTNITPELETVSTQIKEDYENSDGRSPLWQEGETVEWGRHQNFKEEGDVIKEVKKEGGLDHLPSGDERLP